MLDTGARFDGDLRREGPWRCAAGLGERSLPRSRRVGADQFDIVYPPTSILAEPPVAVVDGNVDAKGTRKIAEAYLNYLYSEECQRLAAKHHYRPSKPELVPAAELASLPAIKLISIDDPLFGGWAKAQPDHFGDGGVFDQIYKPAQ